MARTPAHLFVGGSYLDGATTDHGDDHGGFPSTRAGGTALCLLSASSLSIHPCLNSPVTGDAGSEIELTGDIDEALGIV